MRHSSCETAPYLMSSVCASCCWNRLGIDALTVSLQQVAEIRRCSRLQAGLRNACWILGVDDTLSVWPHASAWNYERRILAENQVIPVQFIERRIYLIRGHKVMLDSDLADLYQVATRVLNQAVRRNLERFPVDFMFQLSDEEMENWRSQIVTSNPAAKMGLRRPPFAFTEHGVAMLSSVLRSRRAVQLNILIIRAFVRLREYLANHEDLARKLETVERTQEEHGEHLRQIYAYIDRLMEPTPEPRKRRIGFATPEERE